MSLGPVVTATTVASAAYTVRACAGSGGANSSWTTFRSATLSELRTHEDCIATTVDPYASLAVGLSVTDDLGTGFTAADGRFAEWRFAAPSGTTIGRAIVDRDLGNRSDAFVPYGQIDGVIQSGESCARGPGEAFCRVSGVREYSNLAARTLGYGVRCSKPPYCVHGATLHAVWAVILDAAVVLDDHESPVVGVPGGALTNGAWKRGESFVTFDASDNTGIRRRRVVEGATTWASRTAPGASAGGCGDGSGDAYTYLQPCAGARGLNGTQTVTVPDVCVFGDGVHELRAAAEDTGGGETRSAPFSVRVDCTAPEVWVAAGPSPRLEGDVLAPAVSASDGASGVATVERQLSVDGATWMTAPASVEGEAGRTYRFRARAVDEAGNASGWVESAPVSFVAAAAPVPVGVEHHPGQWEPGAPASTAEAAALPAPPAALTAPGELARAVPAPPAAARSGRLRIGRVRRRGSTLIVEGTAPRAYAGIVRVSVRFAGSGRTVVATTRATARSGRWRAALRAPRQARVRRVQATARTRGVRAARPYTPRRRA